MRYIGNCSKFCKMCRILLQNRKRDSSINRRIDQRLNTKRKREKRVKLWKRILSCFLALLLTVYLLPVQVMAEELGDLWPLVRIQSPRLVKMKELSLCLAPFSFPS